MTEQIPGLSIGIGLDSLQIERGLAGLKERLKSANAEMKLNMSAFDRADRSVGKYETRLNGLNRKMEVQRRVVAAAQQEYERMVEQFGEGSREAEKAAREYNNHAADLNNLQRVIDETTNSLQDLREEQRIASSGWGQLGEAAERAGSRITGVADKMKGVGQKMSMAITAPIAGLGIASGLAATQLEDSTVRIQNSLGLTAEGAKDLTNIARDIYKKGFGESAGEIESSLLSVLHNLKEVDDKDLGNITEKAMILAETFESDVNEVTRAGRNLMVGFGLTADKAFDLMAHGAQNGLNFSNEMFDNLSEYAPLFAKMGFSAEEYFQLLVKGSSAGVYNLDYVN